MITYIHRVQLTDRVTPRTLDAIDSFQQLNLPTFQGKTRVDPSESEYWLEQIEKIFDFIECSEGEKIICATFMLQDKADH